ncbi:uncharacterized protein LOC121936544 [Sceloporus undulatus]|uniref:uncharacterized protein LOC121936544 n=1 Tax=Sceloporus undulatus TaxID=8520 RepID=UPI001C4BD01A|nr:uncharacterized protein LOC121936544 [Sceloporus undulatus]
MQSRNKKRLRQERASDERSEKILESNDLPDTSPPRPLLGGLVPQSHLLVTSLPSLQDIDTQMDYQLKLQGTSTASSLLGSSSAIGQVQQEDDPQSHHSYRKLSAITVEWTHRHSIVAPLAFAHETNLHVEREEIGTPLAHNSFVDEPEIPIIEKIRIPIVEISHVEDEEEVDSYAETPEEQDTMTPPTEMSLEEVTPTLPLEIDIPKVTPTLPLEINVPEVTPTPPIPRIHSVKAASPLDKRIRRDMANVTVTAPGCDEESTPSLKTRQIFGEEGDIPPSEMEAQALEMSRSLAYNLQDTYENLLVHLQDLPVHLQQKLYQTCQRMAKLRSDFDSAQSFEDLSHDFLSKSFEIMDEAQGSLDELMEYALQSPKALLWLKDHLPVPEEGEEERVLGTEGAFPIEGEADPLDIQMTAEKRSILIIQQTYDPKGCDDDTLPGKEKEVTSSPRKQDSEDILKTLQTYEPKGCDDEIPSNKQKEEVSPSSKQDWNIMKTLQGYVPKLSENKGFSSEDQEETPPSMKDEEEVREVDILKLQRAHDPKGCDDGVEIVAPPASEQELQDILIVQRAYDPKECYEGAPPEEEKVAPPSGKWEREGILQIQQAYDPKGCDDEIPSNKEKEEVSPSSKQDWNILKTLQGYVPKLSENKGFTSEDQEEIPPSMKDEEEVREVDILKRAHDPKAVMML